MIDTVNEGIPGKENSAEKAPEINEQSAPAVPETPVSASDATAAEAAAKIAAEKEAVEKELLDKIALILAQLKVRKIYFVDDALSIDIDDKAKFLGIVREAIDGNHLDKLKEIKLHDAINFNTDETVLSEHISERWDSIKKAKRVKYFKQIYSIIGQPEAIKDLDESSQIKNFFKEDLLVCLTPNQWDEKKDEILQSIADGDRIIVLFDQDLKLSDGRFADGQVKGETLILELKESNVLSKVIVGLLTHTVTSCEEELPERVKICTAIAALDPSTFFVLAKNRLEEHHLFADGIKKTCLNVFCEEIKTHTIGILETAQFNTIQRLKEFDTYDFDHTVFKSSFTEGVWEPETLLRITDVIFKDEVRKLMIQENYVPAVNRTICNARDISNIEFPIDDTKQTYVEKLKLRHQEMYENDVLLNQLRRPIENGDIFSVTDGVGRGKKFILVAQECDLMVRTNPSKKGKRGATTATILEIETFTSAALNTVVTRWYQSQIDDKKFGNHYYADKFKLEYFENGTTKVGVVNFTKAITIDLNVLDLIVFNELGEAVLNLGDPSFDEQYHSYAWINRYGLIKSEFESEHEKLQGIIEFLNGRDATDLDQEILLKFNRLFGFIAKVGVLANCTDTTFNFGLKRISRLRMPLSRHLLDRYYKHLSRFAELHDFAD